MQFRVLALLLATTTALTPIAVGAQAIFTTAPQEQLFHLKVDRPRPAISGLQPIIPARFAARETARIAAVEPPAASTPAPSIAPSPAPQPAAVAPVASRPAVAGAMLRHLTNNIQGYRLAGEIGSSEWPIYVTEAQASRRLQFRIGYLAAVSVMPEASALTLTINDQTIGDTQIRAVQEVETIVFDIPPGVMRPGFNSVRIATSQRHRVDCSLEATYELWTQIDPTETGLVLPEDDAGVTSISDLGALPPDEQGALPIRAVLGVNAKSFEIERMLRAAQAISLAGRFEQPVVDAGPAASGRYGVNLFVGPASELVGRIDLSRVGPIDEPRAFVLPAAPGRRASIVVTGATSAQVDEAIRRLSVLPAPKGSPQGLRASAAFPGYRLDGGRKVKLRDLGVASEEFTGHLYRAAFNIVMPPDFYAADYGNALLRLAGGYAAGLDSNAQIVVKVDERTAVSLNLLKAAGDVFRDNPLPLPLGFLKPGLNRIEIEAHVPTRQDADCDPLASMRAAKRFLFLDETEIELPPIARIARMPDLAVTATGGFPYAGAKGRPKLYMPSLDTDAVGAAATIVAHFAVAAGRPIDFEIVDAPPGEGQGPTLAVAPLDSFDAALLQRLDMPADTLREAWGPNLTADRRKASEKRLSPLEIAARNRFVLQRNFPMACYAPRNMLDKTITAQAGGAAAAPTPGGEPERVDFAPVGSVRKSMERGEGEQDLLEAWRDDLRREGRWGYGVVERLRVAGVWSAARVADAAQWLRAGFEAEAADHVATQQASLAMSQSILGDTAKDVWTVVTAPNAATLAEASACLVDPRVSRRVQGQLAMLDMKDAKMVATPAESARFIVTRPLSFGNLRLIAAGWMSLHPGVYVGLSILIAALFAASTLWLTRNIGRSSR
ncbi:cellulose biosynthesis cyclic di-GMP-binding regulatory protein BcsB [Methylosinus sp. LW4]|uniref:cellulose biosynthesis cyclic di-GMP-binding regulatory protein BcsB n=1 Tax=Methylosinus sp. LW4 TaxID=136993 RepID=UPI0003784DB2|nr:cellulose biosynthesis cyclic di-GMP-binding regulatory protein BcsB [Methylosinus sp. LW4]